MWRWGAALSMTTAGPGGDRSVPRGQRVDVQIEIPAGRAPEARRVIRLGADATALPLVVSVMVLRLVASAGAR